MIDDMKPVVYETPQEFQEIELYVIHDIHMGNHLFDPKKWYRLRDEILAEPNRYCVIVGDVMENAVPGSKSDVFTQLYTPEDQKEWASEQFSKLKERIIAVVDGNHERNRSTKLCGLYPLYDACVFAGITHLYRPHFAFVDIAVGKPQHGSRPFRFIGYLVHRAKDLKNFSTADVLENVDFVFFGHDHDPHDHPRAKLHYDKGTKTVSIKNVETVDGGSFLNYGGYAADGGYRPQSQKLYKLVLKGGKKPSIQTIGFYI